MGKSAKKGAKRSKKPVKVEDLPRKRVTAAESKSVKGGALSSSKISDKWMTT
jgi:hypothetical protein